MKKLFVGNLPQTTTEESLYNMFAEFGKVHSIKIVKDLFSGNCKGFGFLEMEGHEARASIAGLNGKMLDGKSLKVGFEEDKGKNRKGRRH